MSSEDEMKKFIPEAILQEGNNIVNFKLEPPSPENLIMDDFMNEINSPMEGVEIDDSENNLLHSVDKDDDPVIVIMDIREPLTTLRTLLEGKLKYKLTNCSFSLQDSQILDHDKNLVDLCVQGEGMVQINCEIKKTDEGITINIADVLKPAEEYVEIAGEDDEEGAFGVDVRWAVDYDFKRDQEKLGIPQDPVKWSVQHVRHWLMWAVRQFSLSGIKLSEWEMNGAELLKLTRDEFRNKVPNDPNNSFWVHFELLRSCKIVAINRKSEGMEEITLNSPDPSPNRNYIKDNDGKVKPQDRVFLMNKIIKSPPPENGDDLQTFSVSLDESLGGHLGSGPVQLWQFLLDLLTNWRHRNAIQWQDDEGEFKLENPELVAHLWGIRKNKPNMNYEKLSRALRYYYDGEMISKVIGKRFTYKFVCDLKQLIGYSATELNARVVEAELKAKFLKKKQEYKTPIFVNDYVTLVP